MKDLKYIDLKELSAHIGLSPRTLRKYVTDPVQPLPCFKVGGKLVFKESEVGKWIETFRVKPTDVDAVVDEMISEISMENNNE